MPTRNMSCPKFGRRSADGYYIVFINLTFAACLYSQLIDSRRNCEELTFNQQDDRPTMMPGTLIESVQRGDNTADVKSILPDWFPPLSIVRRHVFPQFHIVNKQYIYSC